MTNYLFSHAMDMTYYKYEGYYSNDPRDTGGGETFRGVSRKNHPDWSGWPVLDKLKAEGKLHMRDIVDAEMQEHVYGFYRKLWAKVGCDFCPPGVDVALFDYSILHGPYRAVKALQYSVGATEDGIAGPNTKALVEATFPEVILKKLTERRLCDITEIKKELLEVYNKGWIRRVVDVWYEAQDLLE